MSHPAILKLRQLPVLVLCAAGGLISWLAPTSFAEPPGHVRVNLTVVVTDGKGNPIPKAHISIPRQGHNEKGTELVEITGDTDAKGEFTRAADFELTGVAHKVVVTVGDTSIGEQLPDQKLQDAFKDRNHRLSIPISVLSKELIKLTIAGSVTDENAVPIWSASVLIDSGGKETTPQFTGQDGKFKFANLELSLGKDATRKLKVSAANFTPFEEDISDDSLRRNSNGTLELPVIRLSSSQSGSILEELKSIVNFLLWMLGLVFVLILVGYAAYAILRKKKIVVRLSKSEIDELLISINSSVKKIEASIKTLGTSKLTEDQLLKHLPPKTPPAEDSKGPSNTQENESSEKPPTITTEQPNPPVAAPDSRMIAKAAYENIVNKMPVSPEPVYLVVEPPRSAGGKMEDKNTYLSELPHSNCSLVLISDGSNSGWVFPNPKVAFNTAAVKDVFGTLAEVEYEANKLGVEPMRAERVDNGRWMLVVN
jgi:hypothetical protein